MSQLVDLHTHLLPGIDDGPQSLEDSLDMARAAVEAGIGTIAATPHLRSDFPEVHVEELANRCENLRAVLDQEQVPLRVLSGAEVSLIWALEASDEELKLASYGQRGTDLLIETPGEVSMLDRLLLTVSSRGFRVTLAHPERSLSFQRDPERLLSLSEQGVLLQVNAGALMARRSPPGQLAEHLCLQGLAQVVASDGHRGERWRPVTDLARGVAALTRLVGPERAQWLASAAPAAIIDGRPLPDPPSISAPPRRRSWLGRH